MAIVASLTMGAPIDNNHVLIVTVRYEAQGTTGSDWGSSSWAGQCYMVQNAVFTFGDLNPLSVTRLPFLIHYAFAPIAGYAITFGLNGKTAGTAFSNYWNIKLQGELIKR